MQSSESIGRLSGTIRDLEYSIQIDVKHFAEVMKQNVINLVFQSYN
ncbi:lysozyme family protein [Peribacillus sp. R9-11]|nr:lysozyme family protein [Peribacillus sp. R9-11]MBK5446696.1 lysozyme family protein [Peribacillus sp. TH24]MBK5502963.1 lysozyme family protein [Peribacillus sp. TH14]WMX58910.1 lysozyme family protein [Peribacillus sp. R9-11]